MEVLITVNNFTAIFKLTNNLLSGGKLKQMNTLATAIVGVVSLGALTWGIAYHNLIFTAFFAPKYENVRRNTFEQSKSFRTGAIQELQNMQFQYIKASPEHKKALANLILHRAAELPDNAMPSDLQSFISNLRN
jgi:hypothetical protein